MTDRPTQTQIRNWLEGRLSPADCDAFEAALEADPDFAEDVLRQQDALPRYADTASELHAVFPLEDAVPAALLARLGLAAASESAAGTDNVIDFAAARARRAPHAVWRWIGGGALAASLALAVMLAPQLRQAEPGAGPDASFELALSTTPSAAVARLANGSTLRPVLSFAAADGRWCREFVIAARSAGETGSRSGIACRTGDGWSIEASATAGDEQGSAPGIRTAAGTDTAPLDGAYARLGASDPVAADQERDLIAKGWPHAAK